MEGDQLIGRIDMKRNGDVLDVTAFWPEAGVAMSAGRIARLDAELARAAKFGGCGEVRYSKEWLRRLKERGLTQITRKRCYHGQHAEESLK